MIVTLFEDPAENVTKLVFDFGDAVAEAVLYRYPTYKERTVICCSVMSGCPMGCRFCGTGDYFVRNLKAKEIVDQVKESISLVKSRENISDDSIEKFQIMFMSMGEPLLNQGELCSAIETLNILYPNASLLVSTSAPKVDVNPILTVAAKINKVGLQFSVHESTDQARDRLIPFKQKLTLEQIAMSGSLFYNVTGRKPFFNYCAHEENSSEDDAIRLLELFNPSVWEATVSVICERDMAGMSKSNEFQRGLATEFSSKLVSKGFNVRVFDPAGQDTIGGGCGQLWYVQDWMKNNSDKAKPSCGFDKDKVHIPIVPISI